MGDKIAFLVCVVGVFVIMSPACQLKPTTISNELQKVNTTVNNEFQYTSDESQFGVDDYWQTPEEFKENGKGDCEDFAIYKAHLLTTQYEIDKESLSFAVVNLVDTNEQHLIVIYKDYWILDNNKNLVFSIYDDNAKKYYYNWKRYSYTEIEAIQSSKRIKHALFN